MSYKKEDFDKISDIFERRDRPGVISITIHEHIDENGIFVNPVYAEIQRLLRIEAEKLLSENAHDTPK